MFSFPDLSSRSPTSLAVLAYSGIGPGALATLLQVRHRPSPCSAANSPPHPPSPALACPPSPAPHPPPPAALPSPLLSPHPAQTDLLQQPVHVISSYLIVHMAPPPLQVQGLSSVPATTAQVIYSFTPLATAFFAFWILGGEPTGPLSWAGGMLLIGGWVDGWVARWLRGRVVHRWVAVGGWMGCQLSWWGLAGGNRSVVTFLFLW